MDKSSYFLHCISRQFYAILSLPIDAHSASLSQIVVLPCHCLMLQNHSQLHFDRSCSSLCLISYLVHIEPFSDELVGAATNRKLCAFLQTVMNFFVEKLNPKITHKHIYVPDDFTGNLLIHFPECLEFIKQSLAQGGKVLVHCFAGISRSSTVRVRAPSMQLVGQ